MKFLYILLLLVFSSTSMSAVGGATPIVELGRTAGGFRILTGGIDFNGSSLPDLEASAERFLRDRLTQRCRAYGQDFRINERSIAFDAESTEGDYSGVLTIVGNCKRRR